MRARDTLLCVARVVDWQCDAPARALAKRRRRWELSDESRTQWSLVPKRPWMCTRSVPLHLATHTAPSLLDDSPRKRCPSIPVRGWTGNRRILSVANGPFSRIHRPPVHGVVSDLRSTFPGTSHKDSPKQCATVGRVDTGEQPLARVPVLGADAIPDTTVRSEST